MDPLSVTASVIAVLQAANTVISICYDFRAAIKDQPWALTRIATSINELRLILGRLETLANESELGFGDRASSARLSTLEALCQDGGTIKECFADLKMLECKLGYGNWAGKEGSKRRALIQSIGWQLKGKDAEDMLKRLDGYKTTLNLAITMDQAALTKAMSETMKDVDENTRSLFKQFQGMSLDDRRRSILQWLSPVDPSISQESAVKIHQSGTNNWFLACKEFESWRDANKSFLWLSGFPGSGKTILMSSAIASLQQSRNRKNTPLLAYFFLVISETRRLEILLTSLAHCLPKYVSSQAPSLQLLKMLLIKVKWLHHLTINGRTSVPRQKFWQIYRNIITSS